MLGVIILLCIVGSGECDVETLPDYLPDEQDCPTLTDRWLTQIQVPWGMTNRATLNAPPEVHFAQSPMPGAGLGVFAATFISKYTWLAEYEGEIEVFENDISNYAWSLRWNDEVQYYIDAYDERTSNWMRWINCPRHTIEENVNFHSCRGKGYYQAMKDIYPGQELLVYYGHNYATTLDINTDHFRDLDIDLTLYLLDTCWDI